MQKTELLGLLLGLLTLPIAAQVNSASLTGLVTDPSDSAVPNVKVTARSSLINLERSTVTDASGYYTFAGLTVGTYDLTVEAKGFQPVKETLTLETAQKGRVDIKLSVMQVETAVTVAGVTPQLSPEDCLSRKLDLNAFSGKNRPR